MGWTSCEQWTTKKDVVAAIRQDYPCIIASSLVGNEFWTVMRQENKPPILVVFLLEKDKDPYSKKAYYAYKDIAECEGPYYYNCPKKLVDMVPEPEVTFTSECTWRARWRSLGKASK